ncbi:unnamed protein product [Medioppia subpectinata]|uniref:SAMD1-like winged helix (WH) domain-containing protein n=1 Tax=Medioppia subpectinata TaxID=1979941 RepID=A0A7R9KHW7_9ACAR|nr:unnamed protein product [Medioppia subpectinata]CAG2103731.1 unnamed protein product [Medioppia subpectinata]
MVAAKSKSTESQILDIPITDSDREILLAVGKIKRQKQRPSVDRLYNICSKIKDTYPQFGSKDGIQIKLNDMIERNLMAKVDNEKGSTVLVSYREMNSAIAVVQITNPKRSRVKPNPNPSGESAITFLNDIKSKESDKTDSKDDITKTGDENNTKSSNKSRPSKPKKKLASNECKKVESTSASIISPNSFLKSSSLDSTIDSVIESTVKSSVLMSEDKELLEIETNKIIDNLCNKPVKRKSTNGESSARKPRKKSAEAVEKPTSTLISIEESIQTVVAKTYSPSSSSSCSSSLPSSSSATVADQWCDTRPSQPPSSSHKSSQPHHHSTHTSPKSHKHSQPSHPKCGMCGNTAGDNDELITCSLCGMSGHAISCLNCSEQLLKRIKESARWECPNCKKCVICGAPDVELIICNDCDRGYHSHKSLSGVVVVCLAAQQQYTAHNSCYHWRQQ